MIARSHLFLAIAIIACLALESSNALSDGDIFSSKYESKLKKLSELLGSSFKTVDGVKETSPFKVEEISALVDSFFPTYSSSKCFSNENCAKNWMKDYNLLLQRFTEKQTYLKFYSHVNETVADEENTMKFEKLLNKFDAISKKKARSFLKKSKKWDAGLRRMFYLVARGFLLNDDKKYEELEDLLKNLRNGYMRATICETNSTCTQLSPFVSQLFATSRNYSQLLWAWKDVHSALGSESTRKTFDDTLTAYNNAAKANKYKSLSDVWIGDYEEKKFDQAMDKLFVQLKPLYLQLHKYVRKMVHKQYADSLGRTGYDKKFIQEHLLGNPMKAESWEDIYDLVKPYPDAKDIDVDSLLREKKYTAKELFKEAEKFFVSIGLFKMNPTFWKFSVLEKPENKSIVCYPITYDFLNGFDYRVKMCTKVSAEDYMTVHKKLSFVEYDIAFRNLYPKFRKPAVKPFRDGFGNAVVLSTANHEHLKAINLIDANTTITNEQEINFLMKMALKKVASAAFAYTAQKWSNQVFMGQIKKSEYNSKWWAMRNGFNGVEAPIERTEKDFDAASLYRISNFMPYSDLFVSTLLEFQMYEALCKMSGHNGDLHKCDFYNSKEAGKKLKEVLELGSKRKWSYALYKLTGNKYLDVKPMFNYFKPLTSWLEQENKKN